MSEAKHVIVPLSDQDVEGLSAAEQVLLFGSLITARDAAHKRLVELVDRGEPLPVDLAGQVI